MFIVETQFDSESRSCGLGQSTWKQFFTRVRFCRSTVPKNSDRFFERRSTVADRIKRFSFLRSTVAAEVDRFRRRRSTVADRIERFFSRRSTAHEGGSAANLAEQLILPPDRWVENYPSGDGRSAEGPSQRGLENG